MLRKRRDPLQDAGPTMVATRVPCSTWGQLGSDDRLATGYRLDRHVEPLLGEQPLVQRDVQAGQVGGGQGGHRVVRQFGIGLGGAVLPVVPYPVTRAMITDTATGTVRQLRMFIVASRERLNCGRTRNTS